MSPIVRKISLMIVYFLGVSGVLSLLAICIPILVFYGLIVGVLPGLVLLCAPSAFMWIALFAFGWFATLLALRLLAPDRVKTATALALPGLFGLSFAVAILWLVPQPSRTATEERLAQYQLPEVRPSAPIRLNGDVRFETESWDGSGEAFRCGSDCLWLLSDGGAASVTVNVNRFVKQEVTFAQWRDASVPLSSHARTYRLRPKGTCQRDNPTIDTSTGMPHAFQMAGRASEWRSRILRDYCLEQTTSLQRYDYLLRTGQWQNEQSRANRNRWTLSVPNQISAQFAEVRTGKGDVLLRERHFRAEALSMPLHIFPEGIMNKPHWGWAVSTLRSPGNSGWEDSWEQRYYALFGHIASTQ